MSPRPPVVPLRSMLYVPGTRPDWIAKALAGEAGALVLDLEDAVPPAQKPTARATVAGALRDHAGVKPLLVRVNDIGSPAFLRDLEAVVGPGLTGVVVPKVQSAADVHVADRTLGWLETEAGLPLGATLLSPILETAAGIRSAYEIAAASPRTAYMGGLGVKGGDVERALGYRWSADGRETLALRSQALIDVRAAGAPNPMTGLWTDVADLDGLRAFARQGRDLGYEGMAAIHPSHVPIINEEFSTSDAELAYYRRLVAELERADAQGRAAVIFEGEMVDIAMLETARRRLASAVPTDDRQE